MVVSKNQTEIFIGQLSYFNVAGLYDKQMVSHYLKLPKVLGGGV